MGVSQYGKYEKFYAVFIAHLRKQLMARDIVLQSSGGLIDIWLVSCPIRVGNAVVSFLVFWNGRIFHF